MMFDGLLTIVTGFLILATGWCFGYVHGRHGGSEWRNGAWRRRL